MLLQNAVGGSNIHWKRNRLMLDKTYHEVDLMSTWYVQNGCTKEILQSIRDYMTTLRGPTTRENLLQSPIRGRVTT